MQRMTDGKLNGDDLLLIFRKSVAFDELYNIINEYLYQKYGIGITYPGNHNEQIQVFEWGNQKILYKSFSIGACYEWALKQPPKDK